MKTGIIGGTFDPIHNAHLMLAKCACEKFSLDKVLFMISPTPPHKSGNDILDINKRIEMIKLAVEDIPKFQFSDFEINISKSSYLADTLTKYKELFPDEEVYFILGSDSLFTMDSWYKPNIIFEKANILVAKRNDNTKDKVDSIIEKLKDKYNAKIEKIDVECSDISSTKIRQLKEYSQLCDLVPTNVAKYIRDNELYKNYTGFGRLTNSQIIEELEKTLSASRYKHTLNVAVLAKKLAEIHGENPNKAYLAGLLHDCAKNYSDEKLIEICNKNNVSISTSENVNPYLLHAKVGAYLTETKYNVKDTDIINAVRYHTTGRINMSLLEKIIFIADYIEPDRYKQKNLESLRATSKKDLDLTVYRILSDTIEYLEGKQQNSIDEHTRNAYKYYKNLIEFR